MPICEKGFQKLFDLKRDNITLTGARIFTVNKEAYHAKGNYYSRGIGHSNTDIN